MTTRASRLAGTDRQRGQTTVEWVGALSVVVAILGVVLFVLPTFVPQVKQGTICLVERVLQMHDSCTATKPMAPNEVVCTTSSQTNTADSQLSVLFIKADAKHTLIETTYSNGEVQYTLVNSGDAELQAKLFQAEAQVGSVGFDAELTAAAGGQLEGSHTWTFPNAAAAKSFADQVNSQGGWESVARDWVPGWSLFDPPPDPNSLDKKDQTFTYESAGLVGQLNFSAGASVPDGPSADLKAELKAAGGARLVTSDKPTDVGTLGNVQKGDVQLFLNLNSSANLELASALLGPGAAGSGNASGTAIVTLGPDGSLQQLQVVANADYTARAGVAGKATSQQGEIERALNGSVNDGGGNGYQYSGTLDLRNNPAAQQALAQLLSSGQAPQGVDTLIHQMGTQGTERLQPYTVSRSQSGGGLQLTIADVGGGGSATVSKQTNGYSPGLIKPPNQPWQRVTCVK